MKRADLIKQLEANGYRLLREGGSHSVYTNGFHSEPIPRHNEIKEYLARGDTETLWSREVGVYDESGISGSY
jgi:hypothetical protein